MAKRVVRKPDRLEKPFIDAVRRHDGVEVFRDDWPMAESLAKDGLIVLGPARGPGKAWKRAVLPGREDW